MSLTGSEIRNQEFPQKFRGYSKLDVDAFLQHVGDAMDGMIRKNQEHEDRIAELEAVIKRVEDRESLLHRSLEAMTALREEMQNRTESLVKTAQEEANAKIRQAEGESTRIKEEAEWSIRRARENLENLEHTRNRTLSDFVEFLRAQHELLQLEAERLGIELSPLKEDGDKIVSIKKRAEGEEA